MTKPEIGTKRRCNSCEAKFFDLNADPIVCPKCQAVFTPALPETVRTRRPADRKSWTARQVAVPKVPKEAASSEETEVDTATKSPTAETEEVEGDIFLLDEQDDGKLDAAEIMGAPIGKDDA